MSLNLSSIFTPAAPQSETVNNLFSALPNLPTFIAVLPTSAASAAGFKPPCAAAIANNAASSTAILDIIPIVYALLRNKSLKNPRVPPLVDLPILIASSIACAPIISDCKVAPPNMSPIDLHPEVNAGPNISI